MTVVVDASVTVASLTATGPDGQWARTLLERDPAVAPHLMPVEAANVLRRLVARGELSAIEGNQAHLDLVELRVGLLAYAPFARRVWELRDNVTSYDAWYVAVAEALDCPLATLDLRLTHASGPRCGFVLPSG